MMKRLVFVVACAGLWLTFGGATSASADAGPHVAGAGVVADGCAGCHKTHTAKAGKILKMAQPGLCYSCHGTTGTGASTDVQGGTGYAATNRTTPAGALRGGGFEFALIDSGNVTGLTAGTVPAAALSAAATSSHSVNGDSVTAWGNGAISSGVGKSVSLTCGSCHDPHGNGNFRILKALPTDSGATTPGAIILDTAATKVYTTTDYWAPQATEAPAFLSNVSNWCTTCHTRYLAGTGAGSTDSGDAIFTYRHRSNSTTVGGPSCVKCHVSHGSNAAMSGPASAAEAALNPSGAAAVSSKLLRIDNRGVCQQCHDK